MFKSFSVTRTLSSKVMPVRYVRGAPREDGAGLATVVSNAQAVRSWPNA